MNKTKAVMYITIGLMSLILVYVMFVQFRIVKETDVGEIRFMRETELKETLADYKTKQKQTEEEIISVQEKINEYKQNEESEEATIALLEKEIKEANMKLGKTDVYGEGIIIRMENKEDSSIGYLDLLQLINELLLAGAEAISINDERIVAMSDLVDVANFVRINGERKTSPFVIKAIGDTKHLQSALNIKGGYVDVYGEHYIIGVETGNVVINKYTGKLTLDYVKK